MTSRMRRQQRVSKSRIRSLRHCSQYACEKLEQRVLLSAATDVGNQLAGLQSNLNNVFNNAGKALPFLGKALASQTGQPELAPQFLDDINSAVMSGLSSLSSTSIVQTNLANALATPTGGSVLVDTGSSSGGGPGRCGQRAGRSHHPASKRQQPGRDASA